MSKALLHEDRILLAIEALKSQQIQTIKGAAALFDIPYSTLQNRVKGRVSRQESQVPRRKLLPTKEAALIQWIESLDNRGMPPTITYIRQIANLLLLERSGHVTFDKSVTETPDPKKTIGENWVRRLLKRQPYLTAKYSRKYDY